MKIFNVISGDLWGGKEAQVLIQLEELKTLLPSVEVILFNSKETHIRYKEVGLNCHVFEEQNGFANIYKNSINLVNSDDLLVAHGYKEFFLALRLKLKKKCKIIIVFHGNFEPQKSFLKNMKSKLSFNLHRLLSKFFADAIVCVSEDLKTKLNFNNAHVIKNCVKLGPLLPKRINRVPVAFMAGRIVPVKRYDLAIEAVKNINIQLKIAGEGILKEELEKNAPKNVTFLGFINEINLLLSQADVFIICSDSEGIPTILLEALASGVKCIATSVGGIPEVIKTLPKNCCKLIPAGDVRALEHAISDSIALKSTIDVRKQIEVLYSPKRAAKEYQILFSKL